MNFDPKLSKFVVFNTFFRLRDKFTTPKKPRIYWFFSKYLSINVYY